VVAMVESIARPPRDPRFSVAWQQGAMLRIVVDAVDDGRAMNGLQFVLDIVDESTGTRQSHAIAQTGPGRYENELPSPRSPVIASVRHGGAVIDQRAIAGRYPREFDAIGNNREMMRHLAEVSGGSVIEPDHVGPIELGWPRREVALLPWLALAGAGFLAVGMIVWRRGE
jgi:hypothetical protein